MAFPYFKREDRMVSAGPFNGGIVIDKPMHEIKDSASPDMLNMIYENGVIKKRNGQKIVFEGERKNILSCYKNLFCGYIIYSADGKLLAYNPETEEVADLGVHTEKKKGEFFSYNGYLYYTGCDEYYRISRSEEGFLCEVVEGYVPLRYINCDPQSGTGDDNEPANLLTGKFVASYNTIEGMAKLTLPVGASGALTVTAIEKDGSLIKAERYRVINRTVEFSTDLVKFKDGHNNLLIYLDESDTEEDRKKITGCNISSVFGGNASGLSEGTRVFLSGNRKYPDTFFKSELRNPEYFPADGYEMVGDSLEPITAFGKQGGGLVIFKENSIYVSLYSYSTGEAVFTLTNISPDIGCDLKNTLKTVNNTLVWMNSKHGVLALGSLNRNSTKNVVFLSGNINGAGSEKALLGKDDYTDASAFVYDGKYHLCVGDYCYVLCDISGNDSSWYLYSGIECRFSADVKTTVYLMGTNERITCFSDCLYDFDKKNPIPAHYVTKAFTFGTRYMFKTVKDISLYINADRNTYAEISCSDENGGVKSAEEYRVNKFSFDGFCFSDFTFRSNRFSAFLKRKILRRRVKFFYMEFRNSKPLSDMAISSIAITYKNERGVKVNGI